MKIPFINLKIQYHSIKSEINKAIEEVLENTSFILGDSVKKFEEEFSEYCGVKFAIGINSGTAALHLALLAHDIGPGDEVITVSHTFIATAEAISMAGAKPVFVDIDEKTYNMDVSRVEEVITKKTKAILPVHLYGQPVDIDPLLEISKRYSLFVIEDACQAHGAEYKGQKVGSFGDSACFSFYPGKNLGAYGEGGIVVTNDEKVASKIRMLRDHGQSRKYYHELKGYNCRLEGIQGAVLRVKLKRLETWNEARRRNAELYNALLKDSDIITPFEAGYAKHVYHLYVIRSRKRDELQEYLASKGVTTGLHYPLPVHLQKAYRDLGYKEGAFPVTEKCAKEILSLPMFPELKREQIEVIAGLIKGFEN